MSRTKSATVRRFDRLVERLRTIAHLTTTKSLLEWDMQTMMPAQGAGIRAEALEMQEGLLHRAATHHKLGDLIDALTEDAGAGRLTEDQAIVVRKARREYLKQTKIPTKLATAFAGACAKGYHVWAEARKSSDFASFAPSLDEIVRLQRNRAVCLGYVRLPYDALLDEYEEGNTVFNAEMVLSELGLRLTNLLRRIKGSPEYGKEPVFLLDAPIPDQRKLNERVATYMGFDFQSGRLDESEHPFTEGFHPTDVRLTTRYFQNDLLYALFGTIHEAGHGLYEQGLPKQWWGTALGTAPSMAIHESQSRFWENVIGRSLAFAKWLCGPPNLYHLLDEPIDGDYLYQRLNVARPSLIRTEADEVTYNLHVLVRFEMERDLINGDLPVADVPATWNARIFQRLGIRPSDDADGCLQDVHWSAGLFGYFPSYAFGNINAAMLEQAMRRDIPSYEDSVATGDFAPILDWMHRNIHAHGGRLTPAELIRSATGSVITIEPFMEYLEQKFGEIYGL